MILEITLTCILMQDRYLEHPEFGSVSCIFFLCYGLYSFTMFYFTVDLLFIDVMITRWDTVTDTYVINHKLKL